MLDTEIYLWSKILYKRENVTIMDRRVKFSARKIFPPKFCWR